MGGAERQVCDLADQFSHLGHRVLLISMTGEIIISPRSKKARIVALNMTKHPLEILRAYYRTCKIIIDFKPDVVHSHMIHANIFSRLVRLKSPMPKLICTAHSSNEGGLARMLAYRLTDTLCDLNTNVSQDAVNAFITKKAVHQERTIAMHNGININRFSFNSESRNTLRRELNLTEDTPLILSVGRLTNAKDYPNLLSAFSDLRSTGIPVHLAIIGSGEEYTSLTAMVIKLGLMHQVHFLGLRRNVHEWMCAADIFVLSSAWEGFGLVVAEAMACQRIVVATDCGGVKEVVGNCGILVPPKNHFALANGIKKVLQMSSDEIEQLGVAARKRIVAHFSLNAQAERWLSLYQSSDSQI